MDICIRILQGDSRNAHKVMLPTKRVPPFLITVPEIINILVENLSHRDDRELGKTATLQYSFPFGCPSLSSQFSVISECINIVLSGFS